MNRVGGKSISSSGTFHYKQQLKKMNYLRLRPVNILNKLAIKLICDINFYISQLQWRCLKHATSAAIITLQQYKNIEKSIK